MSTHITPRAFKTDVRVTWRDGYKPTAFAHTFGKVFLSKGRVTYVIWDGTTSPVPTATVALVKVA